MATVDLGEPLPREPRTDRAPGTFVELRLAAPTKAVSVNQESSMHFHERAEFRRAWRAAGHAAARAARDELGPVRGCAIEVSVALPVPDRRRRDALNYAATVKPLLDGLTDSLEVWPDDNDEWIRSTHICLWRPSTPDLVLIRLQVAGVRTWPPSE